MRCRHRVSKLLLLHGRVYAAATTWTQRHRRWLARQRFEQAGDRARLPRRARCRRRSRRPQGRARGAPLPARTRGRVVADRRPAALLPRHRHPDGVRALLSRSATSTRFQRAPPARLLARTRARARPVRREPHARARSPRPARATRAGCWSRPPGTTCASRGSAPHSRNRQQGQPAHVLQIAWRAQHRLYRLHQRLRERGKPAQRRHRRRRPRTRLLPLGRRHGRANPTNSRLLGRAPGQTLPARAI